MKKIETKIAESLEELHNELSKYKDYRYRDRIKSLIYLLEDSNQQRIVIAKRLGINRDTLQDWYKLYREKGLKGLLQFGRSRKTYHSKYITPTIHKSLEEKVQDGSNPLVGYKEAVHFVLEKHQVEVPYDTLRKYLKKHFGTKLKSPRKSHYKKNEAEGEAFKKNL